MIVEILSNTKTEAPSVGLKTMGRLLVKRRSQMSNKQKKGVRYSFAGQYYTGSKDTAEQVKNFSLDVVFPAATPKALSLFKTGLNRTNDALYRMMIAKYPDFKRVRTQTITNVVDLSGAETAPTSIATMNTNQLKSYIKKQELGIDVAVYEGDITRLREAIIRAEEDPEGFKEIYKSDVEAYEFNKSLNDLNYIPENNAEQDGNSEKGTANDETEEEVDAADLLGLEGADANNGD